MSRIVRFVHSDASPVTGPPSHDEEGTDEYDATQGLMSDDFDVAEAEKDNRSMSTESRGRHLGVGVGRWSMVLLLVVAFVAGSGVGYGGHWWRHRAGTPSVGGKSGAGGIASGGQGRAPNACYCGKSISEALSRNCQFDVLASAWLPYHCRNDTLTAEFMATGPGGRWTYYADKALTREVSLDYVKSLSGRPTEHYWVPWEFHILHCLFNWQKQQYAAMGGGIVMEERFDDIGHIRHCAHAFVAHHASAGSAVFDSALAATMHSPEFPDDPVE